MREKSDATFEPFLFRWHLFLGLFLSLTWLCVPHVRQTISPSSWLKTVPRQTEHWLAMGERRLVKRTLSFHVVAAVGPATGKKVARPPKLRSFRRGNKNSPSAAMPLARATAPFLAIALALCACVFKGASALESECSACEVVAVRWEKAGEESVGRGHRLFLPLPLEHPLLDLDPSAPLSHRKTPTPRPRPPPPPSLFPGQAALASRIAAEGSRSVLDLRGRLGPGAGQRKGKRLDWGRSETRFAGLVEGLCDPGSLDADYAVRKREREKEEETVGLSIVAKDDDEDEDEDEDDEGEGAGPREVMWLRRGEDESRTRGFERVTEAREKDSRAKQLEAWCGRLVSEVEEGLASELAGRGGGGASPPAEGGAAGAAATPFDARAALCERLTRSCAPAKRGGADAAPSAEKAAPSAPSEKRERSWRGEKKKQQQREEL